MILRGTPILGKVGLDDAEEEAQPYFEEEDHIQEEAAALWVKEDDLEGNYFIDQATSSVSASNPWDLYEARVICVRDEEGQVRQNSSSEKIMSLREWGYLVTEQRVEPRRQNIRRPEWEKLPWTGHLCFLFTRAWDIGRLKSHHKKVGDFNQIRTMSERARARGSEWMRGSQEPQSWDQRLEIDKNAWPETWLMYQRDLEIQSDMEWLSEEVYQLYQVIHLDQVIRKSDKLWGDFQKRYE